MKSIMTIVKEILTKISNSIEKDDITYRYNRSYENKYTSYRKC